MTGGVNKARVTFLLVLGTVLLGSWIAWLAHGRSLHGIDDANIYMIYMRNLAGGHGFVYNVGGERVEGFTSLLWTLLGAFYSRIWASPELPLLATNIGLVTYTLWRLIRYVDAVVKDERLVTPAGLFVLGLLLVIPGYFEWTVLSLLETGVWSCLLVLLTLNLMESGAGRSAARENVEFGVLLVCLVFCRPEAMVWGALFLAAKFVKLVIAGRSTAGALRAVLPCALAFAASVTGLIAWREWYFGWPFPNTYYAKVSSDPLQNAWRGLGYLADCFRSNPPVLLGVLLAARCLPAIRKEGGWRLHYVYGLSVAVTGLTLLLPVLTGGDHFAYARFVQPTVPVILMSLLLSLRSLAMKMDYAIVVVLVCFAGLIPPDPIPLELWREDSPLAHEWKIARDGRERGERLDRFFDRAARLPSQGVMVAGGQALGYRGLTLDVLGLNNVRMAHADRVKRASAPKNHASFNKDVFFEQAPDLFWYAGAFVDDTVSAEGEKLALDPWSQEIFDNVQLDPRFAAAYSGVAISRRDLDFSLRIFAAKSFLRSLDPAVYSWRVIPFE